MRQSDIKVGDVLRIRQWEDMEAEFGVNELGDISPDYEENGKTAVETFHALKIIAVISFCLAVIILASNASLFSTHECTGVGCEICFAIHKSTYKAVILLLALGSVSAFEIVSIHTHFCRCDSLLIATLISMKICLLN